MNSYVYGVSFESKWVMENILKFLLGHCQHVGITDTNPNVKSKWYHNLGYSCAAVMGG